MPSVRAKLQHRVRQPVASEHTLELSREPAHELLDEDTTYLRLIRLVRERRTRDAQLVAVDYLARFPHGFRRADAARLLQAAADDE
jgi:hypothetical protein